jgi:hypothetical protein
MRFLLPELTSRAVPCLIPVISVIKTPHERKSQTWFAGSRKLPGVT